MSSLDKTSNGKLLVIPIEAATKYFICVMKHDVHS